MKVLFIRLTGENGFLRCEFHPELIQTTMAYDDNTPEWIKRAPVGTGNAGLSGQILADARFIARSYNVQVYEPVDVYRTWIKDGGEMDEAEMDVEAGIASLIAGGMWD